MAGADAGEGFRGGRSLAGAAPGEDFGGEKSKRSLDELQNSSKGENAPGH